MHPSDLIVDWEEGAKPGGSVSPVSHGFGSPLALPTFPPAFSPGESSSHHQPPFPSTACSNRWPTTLKPITSSSTATEPFAQPSNKISNSCWDRTRMHKAPISACSTRTTDIAEESKAERASLIIERAHGAID